MVVDNVEGFNREKDGDDDDENNDVAASAAADDDKDDDDLTRAVLAPSFYCVCFFRKKGQSWLRFERLSLKKRMYSYIATYLQVPYILFFSFSHKHTNIYKHSPAP